MATAPFVVGRGPAAGCRADSPIGRILRAPIRRLVPQAPTCVVCGAKIEGERIGSKAANGEVTYRHPKCKKPPETSKKKKSKRVGPAALATAYAGVDPGGGGGAAAAPAFASLLATDGAADALPKMGAKKAPAAKKKGKQKS